MLKTIWSWFIDPSNSIKEPDLRRKAQLMMALSLLLVMTGLITFTLQIFNDHSSSALQAQYAAETACYTLVMAIAYGLSRTRNYNLSAVLIVIFVSVVIFETAFSSGKIKDTYWLVYLILPILLSSLFLPHRITVIVVAAHMAGMLLFPVFIEGVSILDIPLLFIPLASFLILVTIRHRDLLEQDRKSQLAESEKKFRTLVENMPGQLVTLDRQGAVLYTNRSGAVDMLTGKDDELSGDSERYEETLAQAFQSGQTQHIEIAIGNSDIFGCIFVPIKHGRQAVQVMVISKDITSRKQTEKELMQYRNHLEELVSARTAELTSANERLEALSRAKDEFVSNVSHELRTPITILKLYHKILKPDSPKFNEQLDVLKRATERLNLIIEDLLYLSRMDQERVKLRLSSVDINALVGVYVKDRQPLAESQNLKLILTQQPDLTRVQVDEGLIGQVLGILLTNAFNYTPAGGTITVSAERLTEENTAWVGFGVGDDGQGIPSEEQPQIFERFSRGSAAHKSQTAGTGLGLAIAKEIVERHQGRIEVASNGVPGQGTIFKVWLPV